MAVEVKIHFCVLIAVLMIVTGPANDILFGMIEPISEFQRRQVEAATEHCIAKASQLYGRQFAAI